MVVVGDVFQRAVEGPGLAGEQVGVGDEGVGHQQVVGSLALEGVGAVVADQQVVAPVAHQPVAALAAENVVEATHLDVAGAGAAEGAVALFCTARVYSEKSRVLRALAISSPLALWWRPPSRCCR